MNALLEVEGLQVRFGRVTVLHEVSFELQPGETLGLVGESGSGKSTLARAILRLLPAAGGAVRWGGEDLLRVSDRQMRGHRRDLQIVFQDPLASLDPRMSVSNILSEPLEIFEPALSGQERRRLVVQMLDRVGLPSEAASRRPHEFSGGQCQRIGIARAMMLRPKLLVCDEPVSSLDVSIQGQIVNLLEDLQRESGNAMLFISHNLAVVRHVSHRVAVLYRGRLVEIAGREALYGRPAHPYTRALLAAVPAIGVMPVRETPAPSLDAGRGTAAGEGCPYVDRCPFAAEVCVSSIPPLENIDAQHSVACHRWRELVYS